MQDTPLADWRVTFVMAARDQRRTFSLVIPAVDQEHALDGAYGLAYAINEASSHIWKITDERSAELSGAEHLTELENVAQARSLVQQWTDDRTAFPDGAAPVLETVAEWLLGGEQS
jgi:hypothetical protein